MLLDAYTGLGLEHDGGGLVLKVHHDLIVQGILVPCFVTPLDGTHLSDF